MDRLFAILVILIIISSLFVFIKNYQDVRGAFSKELFTSFIAIYFILMLGFALLYFLLSEAGFSLLIYSLQHFCTSSSVSRHDATYFPGNFPGSLEVCRTDDEAAVNDINICHCQKTSVIL